VKNIRVDYKIRRIEIKGDSAVAELDVRVTARYEEETGYVAGDAESPVRMKFFLDKERTKWLVSKTEGLPLAF